MECKYSVVNMHEILYVAIITVEIIVGGPKDSNCENNGSGKLEKYM
jgi:hypothetical protein